jgi:acetyltransferase-like isoleucine patch superfamily enzyme
VTTGIRIGDRVELGPNCVVLDGAEIDADLVVPAGTVVSGRYAPSAGKRLTPSRVIIPQE